MFEAFELVPSPIGHVTLACSLEELVRGANITLQDAHFALGECGLLKLRWFPGNPEPLVVISVPELEALSKKMNIRKSSFDPSCVILA